MSIPNLSVNLDASRDVERNITWEQWRTEGLDESGDGERPGQFNALLELQVRVCPMETSSRNV